eukprot:2606174-Alexandrium_andersonii.AAC.1
MGGSACKSHPRLIRPLALANDRPRAPHLKRPDGRGSGDLQIPALAAPEGRFAIGGAKPPQPAL